MTATTLTYVDAHDAYDDAAYYIDGKLVGRESQINLHYDVYPRINGKLVDYVKVEIPENPDDPYGDRFFWAEDLEGMQEFL